ncbi:hypothetical protein [Stakelama tenebrarum]|uniref:hypothetical protein n=1 Tax=Stakelama tenebrarum TaxID=2711215 RepID=UPI0019D2BF7A|nr:hypothetical protein [Sphingosinithalassobacter tenebrarum]
MFSALSRPRGATRPHLPASGLLAALLLLIGTSQILLWRFLDLMPLWGCLAALGALVAMAALFRRDARLADVTIAPRTLATGFAVALLVLVLGGEGRFFYAHADWQVRGAVLRDLAATPWPFAYDSADGPMLLRAPLGMYLVPGAVGQIFGTRAAELALLFQNAALLGLVLALGASLFTTPRARAIALLVVIGFSGLDLIGQLLAGQPLSYTSDRWNVAIFLAPVTQVFTGPQHALAAWTGALLYLFWRTEKCRLATFLMPLPLLALWSPLTVMGLLPFAAHAGIETLRRRELRLADIAAPAATTLIALPGLLYLAAASDTVGMGEASLTLSQYLAFEALEVGPWLLALVMIGRHGRFGGVTLAITAGVLLIFPLIQVGVSSDFVMRASPPALAILSVAVADALNAPVETGRRLWKGVLIGALLIGLATPAFEIARALRYPPQPESLCNYMAVVPGGFATYVAPLARVPDAIAPREPAIIAQSHPDRCWSGPWPNPLAAQYAAEDRQRSTDD